MTRRHAQWLIVIKNLATLSKPLTLKAATDRKSTRLNSSHQIISYPVFCLKKKKPPKPSTIDETVDSQNVAKMAFRRNWKRSTARVFRSTPAGHTIHPPTPSSPSDTASPVA